MAWELKDTTFETSDGQRWNVEVNPVSVDKVKAELGLDLLDIASKEANVFGRLGESPQLLVATLYILCEEQIDKRQTEPEAFGKSFKTGDVLEGATEALINALLNFFPQRKRELLEKMVTASRNMEDRLMEKAHLLIDKKLDVELESLLARLDSNFSGSAGFSASPDLGS